MKPSHGVKHNGLKLSYITWKVIFHEQRNYFTRIVRAFHIKLSRSDIYEMVEK